MSYRTHRIYPLVEFAAIAGNSDDGFACLRDAEPIEDDPLCPLAHLHRANDHLFHFCRYIHQHGYLLVRYVLPN